ncbi:MAG TPA: ABC transporter permease [Deinococcales bacterium]|nr:ABC transporter permease [Deinococcales bacterium]
MTVATLTTGASPAARANPLRQFGYIWYCELVKLVRVPAFTIPTMLFPIMFFAMFGLPNLENMMPGTEISAGKYMVASFGAYSMLSAALFSFGTSIAAERGLGWNRLLRVTPMNPLLYFTAKVATAFTIGLVTLIGLFAFARLAGGISMPLENWAVLTFRLLAGMVPFIALGLWLGYMSGPNSAAAVANLIFLPMSFMSGLFTPIDFLPQFVQDIAPYLPAYHTAQIAWDTVGVKSVEGIATNSYWIIGYTLLFLGLAVRAYKRDEGKSFG